MTRKGKRGMTMKWLGEPEQRNWRWLAFFAIAGIAAIAFGVFVQVSGLELEVGTGPLNIIVGCLILAALPFIGKK
jgi:hypothetical protein